MVIKGLDKLTRELKQAEKAMGEIDGELGQITYDPNDPASIEQAIQNGHNLVDDRLGSYASNPFVSPLIDGMKVQIRETIIEHAAEARLKGGDDDAE